MKPQWQQQIDALLHPTPEQEMADLKERLAWWQHAAAVRAELWMKYKAELDDANRELRILRHEKEVTCP